jgi:hypothetical protein
MVDCYKMIDFLFQHRRLIFDALTGAPRLPSNSNCASTVETKNSYEDPNLNKVIT